MRQRPFGLLTGLPAENWEEVMNSVTGSVALAMFLAACSVCNAQTVLKREPMMMMKRGTVVLIDDGSCPQGQIEQLSAQAAAGSVDAPYGSPQRKCVRK